MKIHYNITLSPPSTGSEAQGNSNKISDSNFNGDKESWVKVSRSDAYVDA